MEVDRIIAERKVARSTREAQKKARKELAVLKDRWWESRADHLQRAADEGNRCLVHQLLAQNTDRSALSHCLIQRLAYVVPRVDTVLSRFLVLIAIRSLHSITWHMINERHDSSF